MKTIVLQRFANREIRFGWHDLPPSRFKATDPASVIDAHKEAELVASSIQAVYKAPGSSYLLDQCARTLTKMSHDESRVAETRIQSHLDITSEFRRDRKAKRGHKPVLGTPYRRTVFGRAARHTLLEAGSVAERWAGDPGKSVVVTLTLPGSTETAYATLAAWSGYVVDRLARRLRKYGEGLRWFFVWELQKRGALHMHLCISAKHSITAVCAGWEVRQVWYATLRDVTEQSGVDLFLHQQGDRCTLPCYWQSDIQSVRKSVAAYFVKYASKEAKSASKGFQERNKAKTYYPSRWWGCQRILRREVEQERLKFALEGVTEDEVTDALVALDDWCNQNRPVQGYRYDFQLSYVVNGVTRPLGYGERFVRYFDDDVFVHMTDWLPMIMQYFVALFPHAIIKCNRMSALHTPVA